jgi:hypothetical protein
MNRPTPLDETQELYSLLSTIADPAAHRARLDELVAQAEGGSGPHRGTP